MQHQLTRIVAAHDASDLLYAALKVEKMYLCHCTVIFVMLLDHELGIRHHGDLAQMRHAQHLTRARDLTELDADLLRCLAGDAGVDLIKDQRGDAVTIGDDRFERQHDARELASRGDFGDGLRNFSLVRGDQEGHGIHALNGQLPLLLLHGEDDIRHIKEPQLLRDTLDKAGRGLLPVGGEGMCLFSHVIEEGGLLLLELPDTVALVLHGGHLLLCTLIEGQELVKIAVELLFHKADGMIAGAELLGMCLIEGHILGQTGQLLGDVLDLDDSSLQALHDLVRIGVDILNVLEHPHRGPQELNGILVTVIIEDACRTAETADDAFGILCLDELVFKLVLLALFWIQLADLLDLLLQEGGTLAAVLLLACFAGCAKSGAEPEPTPVAESQQMVVENNIAVPVEEEPEAAEETPEPEPIENDRINPLTGEPVEEEILANRPFAVMVNNIVVAQPQVGISKADVIYELMEEGGITRMMAFFTDIRAAETIGSIRSARIYNVSMVQAYDAIFVHAGGSDEALNAIASRGVNNISSLVYEGTSAFFRDPNRQANGVEHSLFGRGPELHQLAIDLGYRLQHPDGYDSRFGLTFSETAEDQCTGAASVIHVNYAGGKTTYFTYHEDTGLYTAEQFGSPYMDNGEIPMEFKNVLVLNANTTLQADGLHLTIQLTGSGTGFFCCGGKCEPILWSRADENDSFHYTLQDGTPLALGIGKTFVAVQQIGGYEGTTEFIA